MGSDQRHPVLCDLDGVVWLARHPLPGAPEAIASIRAAGHRVVFVTNNSAERVAEQEASLQRIGIPAVGDVVTSAVAAAALVAPGERVLVVGGPGVVEALQVRGATVVEDGAADVVMVGFDRGFDYDRLTRAATAVIHGARLIGTNDDPTYPTADGPIPGGGSILAAVVAASGRAPTVAGKPHPPMAAAVRAALGVDDLTGAVMVGDRPSTDGAFARLLGCRFVLVQSAVTESPDLGGPTPDDVYPDLAAVAAALCGGTQR